MSATKAHLQAEIVEIIRKIGENKDDCLVFDMNKLLARWNTTHEGQFKRYGFGKMSDFLRAEVGVQELDGKHLIKITECDTSHETEKGASAKSISNPANRIDTDSTSTTTISPRNDSVRPKSTQGLHRLKVEVLTSILDYMENNKEKIQRRSYLTLDELNSAWAQKHASISFKEKGFGSFKSFVVEKLMFQQPEGQELFDCFTISRRCIKKKLKRLEGREGNRSVTNTQTGSNENNQVSEETGDNTLKQEDVTLNAMKNAGCKNTFESVLSSDEVSQSCTSYQSEIPAASASKNTTTETHVTTKGFSAEECNFIRLVTVLYKCGLEAMRDLFLRIHPSWNNKPDDIVAFERGNFQPHSFQLSMFNKGNIYEWDITLICSVLLCSKVSEQKLEQEGYKDAIIDIKKIKNNMLSHNSGNSIKKTDYETSINTLRRSVVKLGFDGQTFDDALQGADISNQNLYCQMFVDELKSLREEQRESYNEILGNQSAMKEGISGIKHDVSKVLEKVESHTFNQREVKQSLRSKPGWEEWVKVKKKLKNLDVENNQYILIADRFKEVNSEYVKALANVPWKLVIDLDPNSDIDGFLSKFSPSYTKGGVVVTFPPSKLKDPNVVNMIDTKRMQWLFANGRNRKTQGDNDSQEDNEEKPKDDIRSWKRTFKRPVEKLIDACCQKLDNMKPILCIVFSIKSNINIHIAKEILEVIDCNFSSLNFSIDYLNFAPILNLDDFPNVTFTSLPQNLFLEGLASLLGISEDKYTLPSNQKDLQITLTQMQYNFLSEYLEILYNKCEEIPSELTDEKKRALQLAHLKKFLCGKAISFPSLFYRHDAERNITKKVSDRMSELLNTISKPRIVQITHAPGSGGTTIARRVLWDLHHMHPCAIVKLDKAPQNLAPDSEGEKYMNNLCERIVELEERCEKTPAILIDGDSRQVRILSDCIVRKIEGKVLILRCANYEKTGNEDKDELRSHQIDKGYYHDEHKCTPSDRNDTYFSKEDEFSVNPRLKDDDNDHFAFEMKYDVYCKIFPRDDKDGATRNNQRERVFHFPMMAMLEKFEKLEPIVNESLEILKNIPQSAEYEIAIIVAFLQLYSNFPTPGSLVARLFKKNLKTYSEVAKHCSETLINLMVPAKAPSKEKFIASNDDDDSDDDGDYNNGYNSENIAIGTSSSTSGPVLQSYSFQHPEVARLVLKHSGRSVDQITQDFIQHKVLENYKKDNENRDLIDNLFLYNKESTEAHFSILVLELAKEANGGRIFEEVAKQTKDVTFFSHVARFFADKKGDFTKARDLIKEGFKVDSNAPIEKKRGVYSAEGHIVLKKMKVKKRNIADIEYLKMHSKEALDLFRKARGNPPWTFPNPLLGEVGVWQFCFEWIIKSTKGDVEEAIQSMFEDNFFAGAIGESIYLLEEVNRIVETLPTLYNHERTKTLANESKGLLFQTIGRIRSKTKREGWQTMRLGRLCEEIASKYNRITSEKDLIRLRVLWMLNNADRKIHLLDRGDKVNLHSWLIKLVLNFKMFNHTRDLMEAAAEQIQPPFDIDEALRIVVRWQEYLPNDPFSYLYQSMFCFLEVCKGSVFDYRTTYESALDKCRKKSQENSRRHLWHYFIGKDGDSVCALLTRSKLETQYGNREKNMQEGNGARKKEDVLDQKFWDNRSRDYLLECTGRIECRQGSFRGKNTPCIMMEPGNVKINVPRNNALGTAYMDYQPDSRVTFVVCFTLNGPIAKGIRFINSKEKKKPIQNKFNRQGSKIEKT